VEAVFFDEISRSTGAAPGCTAVLTIFPGDREFRIVSLSGPTGGQPDQDRWSRICELSLERAEEEYTGVGDLVEIARNGQFTCGARPWEVVRL
jgi:hypothetical protein